MSRKALPRADTDDVTMAPPARRRFGRKFRAAWGHGAFSSLPLAECVLLIGFIMSAAMLFTMNDNGTFTKAGQPVQHFEGHSFH